MREDSPSFGRIFSYRTVGVCGGSKGLPLKAAELCSALGRSLARASNVVIVSGGTKQRKSAFGSNNYAAEYYAVTAAAAHIPAGQLDERVVTVVKGDDGAASTHFSIGKAQRAFAKTSEARRISFVRSLDALVAVGGGDGTRQELALAVEFGIKILPVPGFGGASAEVWQAYRSEVIDWIGINEERASRWEEWVSQPHVSPDSVADDMISALMDSLPKRCFVIMPYADDFTALYDSVIEPVIKGFGDVPIRIDRVGVPGDVTSQIENGLRSCDYAIAVLDELRPNVLYELGFAHAHRKPVVLLNRRDALRSDQVPFDIHSQQRIEYVDLGGDLQSRLRRALEHTASVRRR